MESAVASQAEAEQRKIDLAVRWARDVAFDAAIVACEAVAEEHGNAADCAQTIRELKDMMNQVRPAKQN